HLISALLGGSIFLLGCSKDDDEKKDTGTVKLALANATGTAGLGLDTHAGAMTATIQTWSATSAQVKLMNVYLVADVDAQTQANVGSSALIWAAAACPPTKSEDGTYQVNSSCTDADVAYFELARPTSDVNAELNSQGLGVPVGDYRYVRMGFCVNGPKAPNTKFMAEPMSEAFEFSSNVCGVTSAKVDPPISVGKDEAVTVSVAYDLSEAVYGGEGASATNCKVEGNIGYCWGFPTLTPSFSKP
ncbi:MAG TPA: hypothetical protein VE954_31585, partial [Oligoflexus sp.]|uniref:hypothetical protein n=1 Tax=Oligoflexus sp. TaxID=1971216 RepID=UPI002D4F95FB